MQSLEIYRAQKSNYVFLLLIAVAFISGAAWLLNTRSVYGWEKIAMIIGIIFFSALGIATVPQLLFGCWGLKVMPEGLTVRHTWATTIFYHWSDIEKFGVAEFTMKANSGFNAEIVKGHVSGGKHVRRIGFNFSSTYSAGGLAWKFRHYNQRTYGFDGLLPDDYGMDCQKLADHLNQLREQYASPTPSA